MFPFGFAFLVFKKNTRYIVALHFTLGLHLDSQVNYEVPNPYFQQTSAQEDQEECSLPGSAQLHFFFHWCCSCKSNFLFQCVCA
jgi:hypothetical protein